MAVIGCDIPVRQVVGADQLAQAKGGLWTKTHFYEDGNYLHARTFLVTSGTPLVLEFRIDLRPLEKAAAKIHQRLHQQMVQKTGAPVVGFSFSKAFKAIKNTAKAIGHTKLVKAVGGAIKTVAHSKLVGVLATGLAVAVPMVGVPALAAYGSAKAAIGAVNAGKKLVKTADSAKRTIHAAASVTQKLATAKAQAPSRIQATQANAKAQAVAIAARGKAQASAQSSIAASNAVKAAAAAKAKAALAQGQARASALAKNVVTQVKAAEVKVAPVVRAAASLQQKLADPAVRAKLETIKKQADSAKQVLTEIKDKASHGTGAEKLDAQKSAAIVNLVAKNEARIQAMSQVNAGGLPSLLIDSRGRIVKGKFRIVAQGGGKNPDVLYQGPKKATERGSFTKVSGVPGIGAAPDAHTNWWTLEIKPKMKSKNGEIVESPRWISLQPAGIIFRNHNEASKALTWYRGRGISAKASIVKYTPTPSELKKSQNRIGASPFPPPSPRERAAKNAEYAAWLQKHAPRRHARIGAQTPFVGYAPSPAWATTIGCPCSDQGTQF